MAQIIQLSANRASGTPAVGLIAVMWKPSTARRFSLGAGGAGGGGRHSRLTSCGEARTRKCNSIRGKKTPFAKVIPGDIATYHGLVTDAQTKVLDADRRPIPGLFAVGNDAASIFGGSCPGAGATLGPAMTFGYVCAKQLADGSGT
jgi:hypothetical protein